MGYYCNKTLRELFINHLPPYYYCLVFPFYLDFLLIQQIGHYCCSDLHKSWSFSLYSICSCILGPLNFWALPAPLPYPVPPLTSSPITPPIHATAPTDFPNARSLLPSCLIYFPSACLPFLNAIWPTLSFFKLSSAFYLKGPGFLLVLFSAIDPIPSM